MVPLPRFSTCAGIPITELLSKDQIDAIVKRTAGGGAEIVSLLKSGSAYYAPSAAAVEMTESILKTRKKILPVQLTWKASMASMDFTWRTLQAWSPRLNK